MLLDVLAKFRERNGNELTEKALEAAVQLMPEPSKIKSDLIKEATMVFLDKKHVTRLRNY